MFSLFPRKAPQATRSRRAPRPYRPRLEALEDRCLLTAGALDTTFGGTGVVATSLSHYADTAYTSLLQANGDIIAAGTTTSGSHKTPSFALVAYTPSGSLDTTFGSGGKAITAVGNIGSTRLSAAQYSSTDPSGNANKIVVVDNGGNGITLARYNPNGTLDTTFGTNGVVTTPFNGVALSVAIQPDGKIVVGGSASNSADFALVRYNPNGSLDTTFGTGGEVLTPVPGGGTISSVVVQPDGKVVVGGYAYADNYNGQALTEFTLARYNSNGSLDSTFGSGGIVYTYWPGASGQGSINALALESNGQIVAVGKASPGTPGATAWGVARYNGDGSLDTTFGTGGTVTLDTPVSYDFHNGSAQAVAIQPNGELVVEGTALDASFNHTYAVATLTPTGSLDPAFGGTGWVLGTDHGATATMKPWSVLEQPTDGKVVVTGTVPDSSKQGAADFAVARYDGTTTP
jgi:uncharacterized delta-60 repeat protein